MKVIKKLIEKIELQSILVLFLTLGFGSFLLYINNSFKTPSGILGTISISVGLLYTLLSFISNIMRENYQFIISDLKSSSTYMKKIYKTALDDSADNFSKKTKEYKEITGDETKTQEY
jgi:hypothetical protein